MAGAPIRKDDFVIVISGKEKGKTGKVLRVYPKKESVVVEKVNSDKDVKALLDSKGQLKLRTPLSGPRISRIRPSPWPSWAMMFRLWGFRIIPSARPSWLMIAWRNGISRPRRLILMNWRMPA